MRFALIFLVSVLIVTSHQYFDGNQRRMPWLPPYLPHSFINENPVIVYVPVPPTMYSSSDSLSENSKQRTVGIYFENIDDGSENLTDNQDFGDIQSRGKAPLRTEKLGPRFFISTATVFTNPFFKTATFTVSSTVTVTSAVRCIPSVHFVNVAAQVNPCRRKRRFLDPVDTHESQFAINPSEPQALVPTDLPSVNILAANHQLSIDQREKPVIDSSLDEILGGLRPTMSDKNLRGKRFFFQNNKNAFVASSTVTSYSFVSTTRTITIDVVDARVLKCLPAGYRVC
ncbi:hypothetical protein GHT06_016050 [Daphnia sinensis]|uniref:Uncharacterized protein n=1 Tax=Daphnia sinensis TaxID=1820382 RepID=A0AAD5PTE4_9CRUS|nr:hypothetical protein GHT06_016050 [Daphnia sinensis]